MMGDEEAEEEGEGEEEEDDEGHQEQIDLASHRLQEIFDCGDDSDAECSPGASGQLRKQLATSRRGEVATLPHVGPQLSESVT